MRKSSSRSGSGAPARVGVLALQGAFAAHVDAFERLEHACVEVRSPAELASLTHLVIPGGESTTIDHLLRLFGLRDPILHRAREGSLALFGTCAGAILLGRAPGDRAAAQPQRLELLDAVLTRNAYGSQRESSLRRVVMEEGGGPLTAVLIRAPRIESTGRGASICARFDDGSAAAVAGPGLLATTFHPELSGDDRFHARFLSMHASCESSRAAVGVERT